MFPLLTCALMLSNASSVANRQVPSLEERKQLQALYSSAPELVREPKVEALWLDDGRSFCYRSGAQMLFVDPADGVPRSATGAEMARHSVPPAKVRLGRVHASESGPYVYSSADNLRLGGGPGEDSWLTRDGGEEVIWSLETNGWSSDAKHLFSLRRELAGVHRIPIVDYAQALETLTEVPYVKSGTALPKTSLVLFDVELGTRTPVDSGPDHQTYLFPIGWRADDSELLYMRLSREAKQLDLLAADPLSGRSRLVLHEEAKTFVAGLDFAIGGWRDVFTPIEGGQEFLWLSERDGWRHLYLGDYQDDSLRKLTGGEFPVVRVVGVDASARCAFVLANGEPRLYDTHLYRVPLDGGAMQRLTVAEGEHEIQLSPSREYFVDTHSSLDRSPVSELRSSNGERICLLAAADCSRMSGIGWTPPEAFVVKAADGKTDLYGVLFKPQWFDPHERYPVIDVIYSGPFMTIVPNSFGMGAPHARRAQALAQLGFVTFLVDPRGTTERSKAFEDATYGRIGELEISDHTASLRQIAATRPYMDLERVGIYGYSWGGYFALRGMLTAPDVFSVGVVGAPGELTESALINEPYMGTPAHNPRGYAQALNAPLAEQLSGELLLIHGTADVNAPLSTSMRMVDALIRADRDFDLLVLPGATHSLSGQAGDYAARRTRDFFLEHLRGE